MGETVIGTGTANDVGEFTIILPAGSATPSETLTAPASDGTGNSVVIKNASSTIIGTGITDLLGNYTAIIPIGLATAIIDSVTGNSMTGYTIKGIATPGNDVVIENGNGEVLGSGEANDSGAFVIEIPIGFAQPKELVSAIAKDKEGNRSEPAKFKLPADSGDGNGNGNGTGNGSGNCSNLGNNGSSGLKNLSSSQKNLPNNGEIFSNWGVLGALLLGAFAFFTFKRTNKKEDE